MTPAQLDAIEADYLAHPGDFYAMYEGTAPVLADVPTLIAEVRRLQSGFGALCAELIEAYRDAEHGLIEEFDCGGESGNQERARLTAKVGAYLQRVTDLGGVLPAVPTP
jgi:hypothetical protein